MGRRCGLVSGVMTNESEMLRQPRELVVACLAALEVSDYGLARTFLADSGFEPRSPIATFSRAEDLIDHPFPLHCLSPVQGHGESPSPGGGGA